MERNDWVMPVLLLSAGFAFGWIVREVTRPDKEGGILERIMEAVVAKQVGGLVGGIPFDGTVRDPNYYVGGRRRIGQFVDPTEIVTEADRAAEILMYT